MSHEHATIVFLASLPPIQSAIKVGADGARVQLDVPETETEAIKQLLDCRGKVLSVAIVVVDNNIEENRSDEQEATKTEAQRRTARRPTELARS